MINLLMGKRGDETKGKGHKVRTKAMKVAIR